MDLSAETPTDKITIQGISGFIVPSPYGEGHTLNEREANVLNQTLHENLRNNFAKHVAEAKKAAEDNGETLDQDQLQADLNEYVKKYEFGVRTGGGGFSGDPIRTEAMKNARKAVRKALKEAGYNLSEVKASKVSELAENAINNNPAFLEQAERVVKAREETALEVNVDLG